MQFKPKTDNELAEAGLWKDGIYDFEVVSAEDAVSKSSGNDMVVLELRFFDDDEKTKTIKDYITSTQDFKLKAAAKAMGLLSQYDTGNLSAGHFEGKAGKASIKTQPAQGDFTPKNVVASYIDKGNPNIADDLADSIPLF